MNPEKQKLRAILFELGFESIKITDSNPPDYLEFFNQWLTNNYHGSMDWMEKHREIRLDVQKLLPGTKSLIFVSKNYFKKINPDSHSKQRYVKIARYALGKDYHHLIKRRLKKGVELLKTEYPRANFRICVDTAPLLEKIWAMKSGLGFMGKNTNLIQKENGSWFFIGALLSDKIFPPDRPELSHCGKCRACLDACPTGAFPAPYVLDARKCISYLTIEHKGDFNRDTDLSGWLFGCDICQEVCPFNRFSKETAEVAFQITKGRLEPSLTFLKSLDEKGYKSFIKKSAMQRLKYSNFRRNLKNLEEPTPYHP
ncbi:tRNA epoxyqueuosine(34) reductase QueG [Candidatus Riflebacteria bacterium]